jgi:hypothetical protein
MQEVQIYSTEQVHRILSIVIPEATHEAVFPENPVISFSSSGAGGTTPFSGFFSSDDSFLDFSGFGGEGFGCGVDSGTPAPLGAGLNLCSHLCGVVRTPPYLSASCPKSQNQQLTLSNSLTTEGVG